MDLNAIIAALKTRCPSFTGNVAGAAEYKRLPDAANLAMPAAYVIPLDDSAAPVDSSNGRTQVVTDSFAVIVVLSNVADERGQGSITSVRDLRAVLWAALLGWSPDAQHGPVSYEGGQLIDLDRARLYYQFEFSAQTEISEADTYQGLANAALSPLQTVQLDVDMVEPFDPNRVPTGQQGPDGTPDAAATISLPQ